MAKGERRVDHVTLVRPGPDAGSGSALSAALPHDVLEQVRGRVRLLASLLLIAFAFDPVMFFGRWGVAVLRHETLDAAFFAAMPFQWVNLAAVAASAVLRGVAGNGRVSASRLHTLGLVYSVAICFVIGMIGFWQFFISNGILPNLTWVPAIVILFPLILPGPPRRMLAAAVAAGAMAPLALALLDVLGKVSGASDGYAPATIASAFAVGFSYMGARVVYGLGRQVAAAREMGSYQLEAKLGQGGMGEVWRARHHMLARPAAIKLIRPALAADEGAGPGGDLRRRFEREAQVTAGLRSPHTVTLFDFGVTDDGAFYYAMELLEGLDADTIVKRFGPFPAARVIHVLQQVCHSLAEAGAHGLVHRDIKPANIFLCRYGEEYDFVKVLDFGLVKALGESPVSDADAALTQENVIQGTPAFMAPEQALGKAQLDGRVDIYAAGCVAFWLLTGRTVFRGDTAMEILLQHAKVPPPAPSTQTKLPVPQALDRLVLDCLAKSPDDRPQSARELAQRLSAIDNVAPWTEEQARSWWASHQPAAR